MTKALENLIKAIEKYRDFHKGECSILCMVAGFDKNIKVIDDKILAHSSKEVLQINIDEIQKMLDKEKKDFVYW